MAQAETAAGKRRGVKELLYGLVSNGRNASIEFSDGRFKVRGEVYGGIHASISKLFIMEPMSGAYGSLPRREKRKRVDRELEEEQRSRKARCLETKDIVHGSRVDEQMTLFTRIFHEGRRISSHDADWDPCLLDFIGSLRERGYVPYVSQFKMFSDELKMATAADLICVNKSATRSILVELKCTTSSDDTRYKAFTDYACITRRRRVIYSGDGGTRASARGSEDAPVLRLENSWMMRDQLQLLIMKCVLQKEYGFVFDDYYLVRVSLCGASWYGLNRVLVENEDVIYDAFRMAVLGDGTTTAYSRRATTSRG